MVGISSTSMSYVCVYVARDLESTRQENKQKLELMRREHELEVTQLTHLSQLRKEELEVHV